MILLFICPIFIELSLKDLTLYYLIVLFLLPLSIDVSLLLMEKLRYYQQKHFVVLYLSTKNMVIHQNTLFNRSLNTPIVHPREIYKEAVNRSVVAIILGLIGTFLYRPN